MRNRRVQSNDARSNSSSTDTQYKSISGYKVIFSKLLVLSHSTAQQILDYSTCLLFTFGAIHIGRP